MDELTQAQRWAMVKVQAVIDAALAIPTEDLVSLANALPLEPVMVHESPFRLRDATEAVLALRIAGRDCYGGE